LPEGSQFGNERVGFPSKAALLRTCTKTITIFESALLALLYGNSSLKVFIVVVVVGGGGVSASGEDIL